MEQLKTKTKAERLAAYKAMPGCRYEHLTVTEFIGSDGGSYKVRAVCDCGAEFIEDACRILTGRIKSCPACRYKPLETICWTCANACDRHKCPWAGGKPRSDWKAVKTRILRATWKADQEAEYIDSYHVIECPDYSPDRRQR